MLYQQCKVCESDEKETKSGCSYEETFALNISMTLIDCSLFAFRPLSGKQKTKHLCALSASNERSEWAVKLVQIK